MTKEEAKKMGATHCDILFDDIFYKFKRSNWYVSFGDAWLIIDNYHAFWTYNYFNMKPLL